MNMSGKGTLFWLPPETEEVHPLDLDHVATMSYDGEVQVFEGVGTTGEDGLIYEIHETDLT